MDRFPRAASLLLPSLAALRRPEGGRSQRGGAALARHLPAWAVIGSGTAIRMAVPGGVANP